MRILRTPTAVAVIIAGLLALAGVIYKAFSDAAIAKIPIHATETAEARLNQSLSPTAQTLQATPSATIQSPVTTNSSRFLIEASCLDAQEWSLFTGKPSQTGDCLSLDKWGLFAESTDLNVAATTSIDGFRQGIYTPVNSGTQIILTVNISTLVTPVENNLANLSVGIIPTNPLDAQAGELIIYQRESPTAGYPIFVKRHECCGEPAYVSVGGRHLTYVENQKQEVTFNISSSNELTIYIDGVQIAQKILPFQSRAFWVGYRLPEGGQLSANLIQIRSAKALP